MEIYLVVQTNQLINWLIYY